MIDQLYQKAILKHAAAAVGHGAVNPADRQLTVHNPLCGDRITVSLTLEGEKISSFAHKTKACVLCQASASILSESVVNETRESLEVVYQSLKSGQVFHSRGDHPVNREYFCRPEYRPPIHHDGIPGVDLHIFQPVSDHKNRFTCVTLPFEAALKALNGDES